MSELKTRPTSASVAEFLESIPDEARRKDCQAIARMMQEATKAEPKMWGPSIIGFGDFRYQGASGSTDWFVAGFSPRKQNLTLYIMTGFARYSTLMAKLGKHSTGKSCLYFKRLADVDHAVLKTLIEESVKHVATLRV
ncbi:MAG: DUF1801 domain-containing protein [Longimicrobiales bacterium]